MQPSAALPGLLMPYRNPPTAASCGRKQRLNATHRQVRARVEHTVAHLKVWSILRNRRRSGDGVRYAASAVALMRNLAMTG